MFTEKEMHRIYYQGCGSSIKGTEEEKIAKLHELEATGKYVAESKCNGIWGIVFGLGDKNRYFTRTGNEKHFDMPPIPKGMLLVGEFAYGSEYATALRKKVGHDFMWVFDMLKSCPSPILEPCGEWMLEMDDFARRRTLEVLFESCRTWSSIIDQKYYKLTLRWSSDFVQHYTDEHEGIVLKEIHADCPYALGTKPKHWIKCKKHPTFDVIITDVIMSDAETKVDLDMAATIRVAQYGANDELVDCGKVTIGVHDMCLAMGHDPDEFVGRVCEIRAYKQFKSGKFRHSSFMQMREDKEPRDCRIGG